MPTTLKLFGLCGIGSFDGVMLAVLPRSKSQGRPHRPIVSVAAKQCVLRTANPDFIHFDANGEQHIGWNLETKRLRFSGGSGNAKWDDAAKEHLIDLGRFHNGAAIKLPSNVDYAVVELTDGALANGQEEELFTVRLDGTKVEEGNFGLSVTLEVNQNKLEADRTPLVELKNNAVVSVSNLAAVELGHNHFHHYYDEFFQHQPPKKITIENSGVEIFDCVPPTPLP
jgi:hypothetical protein